MEIKDKIFREYDIRGIAGEDLNPDIINQIGKAFGTYLLERGTKDVLVGRDARGTSESYQKAVIEGLKSVGCDVVDIGLILSSFLYFARQHYKIDGGVMITASHNPAQWNGLKLCHDLNAIVGKEIQKVKDILMSKKFKKGNGKMKSLDIVPIYFKAVKNKINLKRKLKVVVDCGNTTPSAFIPEFLEELGCEPVPVYCEIDPSFPRGSLDPAKLTHYKDLIKAVKDNQADLGVIFDGDGDRVGFVDEKGQIWLGDMILTLLIRSIIPKNPGRKVIVELKDSEIVAEETKRLGGIPIFWKTGHALLDHKVYEEKAILCGEMSCHYWIVDNWYVFDDALYTLARVLEIVSNSDKKLSQLMEQIPKYPSTPEHRIDCPEEKKFEIVKELVEYFRPKCSKVIDIDGIRGYIEDGWFLIRASNTQPMLTIRVEAKTENGLEKIKKILRDKINQYSFLKLDWNSD
ncbi:MAG: phosphomannomutase/phosphoglucomutase [Candidatus Nealsonbacteria bacterium]